MPGRLPPIPWMISTNTGPIVDTRSVSTAANVRAIAAAGSKLFAGASCTWSITNARTISAYARAVTTGPWTIHRPWECGGAIDVSRPRSIAAGAIATTAEIGAILTATGPVAETRTIAAGTTNCRQRAKVGSLVSRYSVGERMDDLPCPSHRVGSRVVTHWHVRHPRGESRLLTVLRESLGEQRHDPSRDDYRWVLKHWDAAPNVVLRPPRDARRRRRHVPWRVLLRHHRRVRHPHLHVHRLHVLRGPRR